MTDSNVIIRNEKETDYREVEELVREAFWDLYVPGCDEHFILHNLRKSSDFIPELDFVAEKDGRIVGQIVYSRGRIEYPEGSEKEETRLGSLFLSETLYYHGPG